MAPDGSQIGSLEVSNVKIVSVGGAESPFGAPALLKKTFSFYSTIHKQDRKR